MYAKLAIRNINRSLQNYIIYFITLTLSVSIIFAFNSLSFSKDILSLAENMPSFSSAMNIISIAMIIIIAFLINYATRFIIKKRKREFGTYMLLGMERPTVAKMFLIENMVIGVVSFVFGILLGTFFFQVFSSVIMTIFDSPYKIRIVISIKATLLTFLYFAFMYILTIFKGSKLVFKMKIYDLIYSNKKNEDIRFKNPVLHGIMFIISIGFCVFGMVFFRYILLQGKKGLSSQGNEVFIYLFMILLSLTLGIYGIYICISSFIVLLQKHMKKFHYKNTNLFLVREITSKFKTKGKTMGIMAILLTLSLSFLSIGLSLGQWYKENIKYEAPFDIRVDIDYPYIKDFEAVREFIGEKAPIKDYVEYKLYKIHDWNSKNTSVKNEFLSLSDYNRLRKQLGLDKKNLPDDRFIIHSEDWRYKKKFQKQLKENTIILINGIKLSGGTEYLYSEPFAQYGTNGLFYITILPDYICENLKPIKSRLIVTNYEPTPQSLKGDLIHFVRKEWSPEFSNNVAPTKNITMGVGVKSWSIANGLMGLSTFSFGALYMSLIFILISATVLALQQLIDSVEHKYRFDILRKLGVDNKEINGLVFKQLLLYFYFPVIVPIIITISISSIINTAYGEIIMLENVILKNTALTFGLFFILYTCYFIATYVGFKRNIAEMK